ncbi:chromate transporter [Telmatospirillum siberiense]|uniref:Chromate transporter n=1 Tax=Telmatospirillum siberiense TaxID=382514 RepID=A0A2N3PVZ0_9PROT|nr:chromate transporter [Telmatospirillum siberiense]PKU24547.1 chromate transporter [Telmatospirillum siberiense]
MKDNPLIQLLLVFVPLSFLSVGGGQSVIADMHRQSVTVYGWMNDAQFLNLFALSRMAPGPGSLLAALIGWQVQGWAGAATAAAGIFVPSSLLVYGLAKLWARYRGARWQMAVEIGLAPVAAGMILATSCVLLRSTEGGWLAWAVALLSTALLLFTRLSPFVLLGGGALAFLLWF